MSSFVFARWMEKQLVRDDLVFNSFADLTLTSCLVLYAIATDLPDCSGGDRVRLICMGKGILMPDTRTLEDCLIPVFKTHPTPVNVSVRPETHVLETGSSKKSGHDHNNRRTAQGGASGGGASNQDGAQASQGCACVIL
jgi:hypothetical protein